MRLLYLIGFILLFISCKDVVKENSNGGLIKNDLITSNEKTAIIILGNVQDAGSPHIACNKECCKVLFVNPDSIRKVVSLGTIDSENQKTFLFEATPDIATQIKILKNATTWATDEIPNGIFVSHAHIGHYTGLMYLGKEAINAHQIPVFAMPKMKSFLEQNGPWGQLIQNENITMKSMTEEVVVNLTSNIRVVPFNVPHRDEYSETVGYTIMGPNKKVLFIPDIDTWEKWEINIIDAVSKVDYAFLDATFYDGSEIDNRDISEIPHPFVIETMQLFKNQPDKEKSKVHFIHLNHTNPLLNPDSEQSKEVISKGFNIARINMKFNL